MFRAPPAVVFVGLTAPGQEELAQTRLTSRNGMLPRLGPGYSTQYLDSPTQLPKGLGQSLRHRRASVRARRALLRIATSQLVLKNHSEGCNSNLYRAATSRADGEVEV